MSTTIPNKNITPDQWYSLTSLFGIGVGKSSSVHNLSSLIMKISIADEEPLIDSDNWLLLYPEQPVTIPVGESEVWVFGSGVLNVQELT